MGLRRQFSRPRTLDLHPQYAHVRSRYISSVQHRPGPVQDPGGRIPETPRIPPFSAIDPVRWSFRQGHPFELVQRRVARILPHLARQPIRIVVCIIYHISVLADTFFYPAGGVVGVIEAGYGRGVRLAVVNRRGPVEGVVREEGN